MRRLRDWWQAWLKDPDWRQMGVLQTYGAVALAGAGISSFLGLVVWVFQSLDPEPFPTPVRDGLVVWLTWTLVCSGMIVAFRKQIGARPSLFSKDPVKFPAPPMASWDRLRTKYGRSTAGDALSIGLIFSFIPALVFAGPAIMLEPQSKLATVAYAVIAVLSLVPVSYLHIRYGNQLRKLGEDRWTNSLYSVRTPAEARVTELASLSDALKGQAMSAATIVNEANVAFAQLQADISNRQAESTVLLNSVTTNSTVLAQNQEAVDALFQVWTDRQQAAAAAQEKRSRRWDVRLAVIFLIIGLAVGVFLPTDTIRQSLGWG